MSSGSLALIHAKMLAIFTILGDEVNLVERIQFLSIIMKIIFDLTVSLKISLGLLY